MRTLLGGVGLMMAVSIVGRADAASDQWTGNITIKEYQASQTGLRIYPSNAPTFNNPAGCAGTPAYYEFLPACGSSQTGSCLMPEARELFERALLSAFLAGRSVNLRINGTSSVCGVNGQPAIKGLVLSN